MIDKMTKTLIHHKKDFSDTDMYVGEMVLRNTIRSMVNEVKAMSCGQNTKKLFTDILLEVGGEKLDKRLKKTINLKYKSDKYSDSNSPYYMQDGDLWMVNDHGNSILLSNGIFCVDTIIKSDGHYYFGGSISSKDGKFVARFELPSSYWGDVSHKLTKEIKSIAGHHMQFSKTDAAKIIEASEILITDKAQKEYRPFGFTDNLDEYFGGKILITANDYIDCSDAKSKYILRKSGGSATKYLGLDAPLEDMKPLLQHLHKELRGFNNTNVMSFLLGTVFISPLTSWMAKNCGKTSALPSMVLHGPSGKGKTGMLILAQNFFGFTHGHLNSFYSTAKALLDNGSKYRDAIFVLDDLKYSSKSETEQRNIKELLQGYADGSSKGSGFGEKYIGDSMYIV
jgi:hypothetical protein